VGTTAAIYVIVLKISKTIEFWMVVSPQVVFKITFPKTPMPAMIVGKIIMRRIDTIPTLF
jgi:hypothetical protein